MPMLTYFKSIGFSIVNFPNSYAQYACEISLPIYPQITPVEVEYIIEGVISSVHKTLKAAPVAVPVN
jgi:dTDP-4-amino-4,6-dideoxygalactose transaminase